MANERLENQERSPKRRAGKPKGATAESLVSEWDGSAIRRMRLEKNFSQAELAVHAVVSTGTLSLLENNKGSKTTLITLSRIAAILNVDVGSFTYSQGMDPNLRHGLRNTEQTLAATLKEISNLRVRLDEVYQQVQSLHDLIAPILGNIPK